MHKITSRWCHLAHKINIHILCEKWLYEMEDNYKKQSDLNIHLVLGVQSSISAWLQFILLLCKLRCQLLNL